MSRHVSGTCLSHTFSTLPSFMRARKETFSRLGSVWAPIIRFGPDRRRQYFAALILLRRQFNLQRSAWPKVTSTQCCNRATLRTCRSSLTVLMSYTHGACCITRQIPPDASVKFFGFCAQRELHVL